MQQGSRGTLSSTSTGLTHTAPAETVEMNKYHLMLAIKNIQQRPKGPTAEQVALPLIFAIGLLLALLPADFKEYWGVPASTWQALVILCLLLTVGVFVWLLLRWLYCAWRFPPKTEAEHYAEIITQMEADRKKLLAIEEEAAKQLVSDRAVSQRPRAS